MKNLETLRREANRLATKITKNTLVWDMETYLMEASKYIKMTEVMAEIDTAYHYEMLLNCNKIEKNKKWVKK